MFIGSFTSFCDALHGNGIAIVGREGLGLIVLNCFILLQLKLQG